MASLSELAAVVTAAGLSSRMGSPKALLDWGGKPLLQHQIDVLAGCGQVVVVLGHEAERIRAAVTPGPTTRLVVHADYAQGRSSSLQAGFRAIAGRPRAVLVTGTDQPLDPRVLAALWAAWRPEARVTVPIRAGRRGHPVILSGMLLDELRQVASEPEGLRSVVRRHHAESVEVPLDLDALLLDLNTPAAYRAARPTLPPG